MSGEPPVMPRASAPMNWSYTDRILGIYDKASLVLVPIGMIYLLFTAQFALFGAVFVTYIFLTLVFSFLKDWALHIYKPYRLGHFRKLILAGSAIITVAAVIPRVVVFLGPEYNWHVWYICLTSVLTICLTWEVLVKNYKDRCEVFFDPNDNFYEYVNYANLFLFLLAVFYSFSYTDEFLKIFFCQAWFAGIGAPSTVEFCQVARWKIKLVLEDLIILEEEPVKMLLQENFSRSSQFMRGWQTENPFSVQ
ncbi:hypothetical protein CAEBREN_17435 [Caenorhabditis brenneri]|uniref:Uncharacterized protein n=1 Tax=Caenorhabditis brenneri TaxID=135651 RepID=G0N812_CAEBE|nr:hypothetical protein CAEBREN_17435 [Caenorhabditis brenneri]